MASIVHINTPVSNTPVSAPAAVPSLRANFRWTFAGNVIYALCQWGMLSVLAKLGSAAIVGQFALALAIAAPVFMFTNLQLRGVQATDARSDYRFAEYFTLRMIATLFGFAVISTLALLLKYDWNTRLVVLLVAAAKAAECLSDVIAGLLQKEERLDRVALSLIIRGLCSLGTFSVLFAVSHSLMVAVLGMVITWSAVLFFYDVHWASRFIPAGEGFLSFHSETLKRLCLVSLPLGVVMTLVSLNVNIPRYLLQHYLGSAQLGIFASLAYLLVAVNLIVNALGQSASTRLAHMFAERRLSGFKALILKLVMLGGAVIVIGVPLSLLIGREVLGVLYRPEYGNYATVLAIMAATAGITTVGSFLGYGMTSARCFRAQVPVTALSTLAAAVGAAVAIPRWCLLGAASALLFSSLMFVGGSFLVLRSTLKSAVRRSS